MLMSQAAMSAAVTGLPNCGPSAAPAGATAMTSIAAPRARRSSKHIARLPGLIDLPAGDGIVVVVAAQASLGDELRARGLHHAGVVGGAALQHGGTAVPLPGGAEAGQRLGQDRLLQGRWREALPAVGRDLDLPDAAIAGPGESGNLVEAPPLESEAGRRTCDDRFHLDREHDLPGLILLERDRVFR